VGEITAILPDYNEEVSIGSIVLRTRKFADRVIVIRHRLRLALYSTLLF
jgi:hypothetical protein